MAKRPRDTYGTQRDLGRPERYTAGGHHRRGQRHRGGRAKFRRPDTGGAKIVVKTPRGEITVPLKRITAVPGRTKSPIERRLERMEELLARHGVQPSQIDLRNLLDSGKPHNVEFLDAWEAKHCVFSEAMRARRRIPEDARRELEKLIEGRGGEDGRVKRVTDFLRRHEMGTEVLIGVLDLRKPSHASFLEVWNATSAARK